VLRVLRSGVILNHPQGDFPMLQITRTLAGLAAAAGLLAALTGCDPRPPAPKASPDAGMGTSTTTPSPMPSASAASQ
jgi:hypothetical protein